MTDPRDGLLAGVDVGGTTIAVRLADAETNQHIANGSWTPGLGNRVLLIATGSDPQSNMGVGDSYFNK